MMLSDNDSECNEKSPVESKEVANDKLKDQPSQSKQSSMDNNVEKENSEEVPSKQPTIPIDEELPFISPINYPVSRTPPTPKEEEAANILTTISSFGNETKAVTEVSQLSEDQKDSTETVLQLPPQKQTAEEGQLIAVASTEEDQTGSRTNIKQICKRKTPAQTKPVDSDDTNWHTVGFFTGTSTTVTNFIDNKYWNSSMCSEAITSENLPDLTNFSRINLEPGTQYRFRLAAINSVGRSDWSEVSSFKTCLPGFPGAPSAIKISKSSEGAHLIWEPPQSTTNTAVEIIEYSVYLAVKPTQAKEKLSPRQRSASQLVFVRVYVGPSNQCTVTKSLLVTAHIDCSVKPAIIFRIAARNQKGYGPATQVRWLQDPVSVTDKQQASGTAAANTTVLSATPRNKVELSPTGGPAKRPRQNTTVTEVKIMEPHNTPPNGTDK